jgi:hypothetical protein
MAERQQSQCSTFVFSETGRERRRRALQPRETFSRWARSSWVASWVESEVLYSSDLVSVLSVAFNRSCFVFLTNLRTSCGAGYNETG